MERARHRIRRLNGALALAGSIVLVAIAYSAHVFSEQTESLAKAVANVAVAELKIDCVYRLVLAAESGQRGFLITDNAAYLEPFHEAKAQAAGELDAAERQVQTTALDAPLKSFAEMRGLVAQKLEELEQTVSLAQSGRKDEALRVVRSNIGKEQMAQLSELVSRQHEALATLRRKRVVELQDSADKLTALTFLGVVAVFLLSALAVAQLVRHSRALGLAQDQLAHANDALEIRVNERTRDLRRANEEIQRYAYIISHDLRAPLVNIIGFAKELDNSAASIKPLLEAPCLDRNDPAYIDAATALNEDIPEAMQFIRSSTTRMDNLIAGILQLSRVGGVKLHPQSVDLEELVRECMASVQHRVNDAGAGVEVDGKLPKIIGDRAALSQVIGNLLDNAAKYLSNERPGRIVVRGRANANRTVIEIEDNGRGVALKDQERIFELFRRAGAQDRPGDGIGLAHVRTLARRMGGDINVRSDGRSGSIFSVTLANDLRAVLSQEQQHV